MAALTFFYIQLTYHYLFISINNSYNSVSHCRFSRRYSRLTLNYINKTCVTTPSRDVLQKLHTNRILCFDSPPNHPSPPPATVTAPTPKPRGRSPVVQEEAETADTGVSPLSSTCLTGQRGLTRAEGSSLPTVTLKCLRRQLTHPCHIHDL